MQINDRTTLLSEPVLGGKKIDLHKLYQEVVAAGGFDQVSEEFYHFHIEVVLIII